MGDFWVKRKKCLKKIQWSIWGREIPYAAYAQSKLRSAVPSKHTQHSTGADAYREHPGQEHDAFAEHTQQELTRTLSIHISFFCECSAKA